MSQRSPYLAIGFLLAGPFLSGCGERGPDPVEGDHAFTIVHSQSNFGNLEPCACNNRTTGGFPRRLTVLEEIRASGRPVLSVDSGNSLFSESMTSKAIRPQACAKAKAVARAMVECGLDAYVFGDRDLTAGGEFFRDLVEETGLPVVAANVIDRKTGNPVFEPYKVFDLDGVKIGVIGLVAPELRPIVSEKNEQGAKMVKAADQSFLLEDMFESRDVRIKDPVEVAHEVVPEVRRKAHLVAILSHMPPRMTREFYQMVPDVDFMLGSHKPSNQPMYLIQGEKQLYVTSPMNGTALSVVDFTVSQGSLVFSDYSVLRRAESILPVLREFRDAIRAEYGTEDAEKIKSLDFRTGEKFERYTQRIRDYEAQLADAKANPRSHFAHRGVTLDSTIADHPKMVELVREYRRSLASLYDTTDTTRAPEIEPQPGMTSYVGGNQCAICHTAQHEFWQQTRHAHAWQTMIEEEAEYDLECIVCHTVGYMERGGYDRPDRVGDLVNVQCENCHGPGSAHTSGLGFLESSTIVSFAEDMRCEKCHNSEHSPDFERETYVARVSCPPVDPRDPLIRGTYGKARRLLREKLKRQDAPLQVYLAHVDLDLRLERYEEALEIAERGLETFRDARMLVIGAARALDGMGRSHEAVERLLALYDRTGGDPVTVKELIDLLLNARDTTARDVEAADRLIEWGMQQYGKTDMMFQRYLAESYHRKGDLDTAITVLQDVIAKSGGRGAGNIELLTSWNSEREAQEEFAAPPPLETPPGE